jgi:hypothetical protein
MLKKRWQPISDTCPRLFDDLLGFLSDVGPCLEVQIYNDLLTHFSGAEDDCLHRLPVVRNGQVLGSHRMTCHAERVAFAVTSLPDASAHESHLRRLLPLLPLRGLQWFNISRGQLEAITLQTANATGSVSNHL